LKFNLDTSKNQSPNFIPLLWHRLPSLWVCLHQPAQPSHTLGVQLSWHCAFRIACATMHISRDSNHTTLCISFFCAFFDCRLPSLWVTSAVTSSPHF